MTKRWVSVVFGLFGACFSVSGQEIGYSSFRGLDPSTNYRPPVFLSDANLFPFSNSFAWMEARPTNFLPTWRPDNWDRPLNLGAVERHSAARSATLPGSYSNDSSKEFVNLHKSLWENVHGEVGFLFGTSSGGRFSRDVESGYIFGQVGDDKFQITVGTFYEHSSGDFSRRGR